MRAELIPHPDSPPGPVNRIGVDAERHGGVLSLWFRVDGAIGDVTLPPPAAGRADDLWRTTCLEAFVGGGKGEGYVELNLSPSGQWQAYAFDGYREGRKEAHVEEPDLRVAIAPDHLEAAARVGLDGEAAAARDWTLALSAVLEHADGGKSYWALAHPQGPPDFHKPSNFILSLPLEAA